MVVTRFKPQFKQRGKQKWQGFPNAYSFGEKKRAIKFVKRVRKTRKSVGLPSGKFRIKKDVV